MNEHNNNRDDNKVSVKDFLEQMGITAAVEKFLSDIKTSELLHELYSATCQALNEKIENMPASIREKLKEQLTKFESGYDYFANDVLGIFRKDLASRLYESYELLDETAAFRLAYSYEDALDDRGEGMEMLLRNIAEEILSEGEKEFVKSWLYLLGELETDEDRFALLKAVMGDDIPEGQNVKVVPVYASDIKDAMAQIAAMTGLFGFGCGCGDGCGEDK